MPNAAQDFQTRSFKFACDIVRFYQAIKSSVPGPMANQLLRCGTSIGANLEEAKAAQSRRDLRAKFSISLKEARETRYWLRLLEATQLASAQQVASLLEESNQLTAILTASVVKLKSGPKGSGTVEPT